MKKHILVCNDGSHVSQGISLVLEMNGCRVDTTSDAMEALQMIRDQAELHHPYELVVADHRLSPMSGPELVRELRADRFPGKILVFAGPPDTADLVAYVALAVDGVMFKPIDFTELQSTASRLLSLQFPQPSFIDAVSFDY